MQQTTLSDACVNNNKEAHTRARTQANTQRSILLCAQGALLLSLSPLTLTLPCAGTHFLSVSLFLLQNILATATIDCANCPRHAIGVCVCVSFLVSIVSEIF